MGGGIASGFRDAGDPHRAQQHQRVVEIVALHLSGMSAGVVGSWPMRSRAGVRRGQKSDRR
jgi:hypothetical protein